MRQMRLGGLILLLILSYFFNPIQPIVDESVDIKVTETQIFDSNLPEELDASLINEMPVLFLES